MTRTITGSDLKARLLARRDRGVSAEAAWLDVLGTPGHRVLLATIAEHSPQSIGALSMLVGRAQPNVSRSLVALVRAGLVEIVSSGRASVPTLTPLGREKLDEVLALKPVAMAFLAPSDEADAAVGGSAPFLFVSAPPAAGLAVNAPVQGRIVVAGSREGLQAAAHRLIDHWWRIWYRRDAPFKVGTFSSADMGDMTLLLGAKGSRVERILRFPPGSQRQFASDSADSVAFQSEVLRHVLRPFAALSRSDGPEPDGLFESKLARLDDSCGQAAEREFCRTAGALQISPYDLDDGTAELVRTLIAVMPEEDARLDFASALDVEQVEGISGQIVQGISDVGERNSLVALPEAVAALGDRISGLTASGLRPWQKGTSAAKLLREHLGLDAGAPVGDAGQLARLCGADDFVLHEIGSREILAFQAEVGHVPSVLVQKEWGSLSSAFFLARAVGDYLVFQSRKSCVSNKYTDRQAVGRAFAAEFMAPAEGVVAMIDEDEQSKASVAFHYGVSVEVVNHQYQNNYVV